MSKPIQFFVFALLLAAFNDSTASSQSDQPVDSPAKEVDSAIDAAEAELRELICSRAADFSHPSQEHAMKLVVRRDYHDERFDAPIRQILKESAETDQWDAVKIQRALKLLPFSKLDPKEQTELVFVCYFKCGNSSDDTFLARDLRKYLSRYPDQTSRLLKEKMVNDGVNRELFPLLLIIGKSSEEMLPMLLEACTSDDRSLAESAVSSVDTLIQQLRQYKKDQALAEQAGALGVEKLDAKFIAYATRIVGRYDSDNNQVLTLDEWRKMLMSPAVADFDKNHSITINEYAAWLQSRQKKKD